MYHLITLLAAIPAQLALDTPALDDPNYIVGAVADAATGVSLGALLEVILIFKGFKPSPITAGHIGVDEGPQPEGRPRRKPSSTNARWQPS